MTERERLIELLMQGDIAAAKQGVFNCCMCRREAETIADFLLENNVFIAPVTEGDSVCIILFGRILPFDVIDVSLFRKTLIFKAQHGWNLTRVFKMEDIGKTVFLTREEAEKALKEREENA